MHLHAASHSLEFQEFSNHQASCKSGAREPTRFTPGLPGSRDVLAWGNRPTRDSGARRWIRGRVTGCSRRGSSATRG